MSTKGVILALVVAIGLALATMALLINQGIGSSKTPVAIPAGERILASFDPARLRSMDVTLGSTTDRLTPDTTPGDWKLETALQTPASRTWPVDSERFRSVLRVLAETRAAGTPAPDAGVGENPATIRLTLDDGSTLTLRLASRRLGGQSVISIESTPPTTPSAGAQPPAASTPPRLALVADSLPNLFTSPGPRGWRRTQLLTGVSLSAVGVRMVTPEASLALARDAGVWSLREPTPATADPEAIRRLFSTLEQVRITRFFDDAAPKPSEAGFDAPTARVILNLERRRAGADDVAIDRSDLELTIGSKADATGSTLFATLDEGRTIVAIDTAALSTLSTDPARWISPFALAATPAEVAGLSITPTTTTPPPAASAASPVAPAPPAQSPLALRRTLDGWVESRPGSAPILQDPTRTEQIAGLIRLLTSTPAQSITLTAPAAFEPLATLAALGTNEQPISELTLARTASPGFTIKLGSVYRSYPTLPDLLAPLLGPLPTPQPAPADRIK